MPSCRYVAGGPADDPEATIADRLGRADCRTPRWRVRHRGAERSGEWHRDRLIVLPLTSRLTLLTVLGCSYVTTLVPSPVCASAARRTMRRKRCDATRHGRANTSAHTSTSAPTSVSRGQ